MAKEQTVIRWGIIGVGDVCENKSGPAFAKVANSALVAVCRRTPGKAKDYAHRHGVPKWFDDPEQLIAADNVDAVYIATPPQSHLRLALAVAKSGKPCLVEKPLARNAMEAAALVGAFERHKVPLYVAYYRRALPRYRLARQWLPKVGKLLSVTCTVHGNKPEKGWRFQRTISGGGLTVDKGSHCMDIIDWFFGPVFVQSAEAGRRAAPTDGVKQVDVVEDFCNIQFSLPMTGESVSGKACFDFNYEGDAKDEMEIVGSMGTLKFAALGLYGSSPVVEFSSIHDSHVEKVEVEKPDHTHFNLIEEIVTDLLSGTQSCSATGQAGLRTAVVIDAALERASFFPRLSMASFQKN